MSAIIKRGRRRRPQPLAPAADAATVPPAVPAPVEWQQSAPSPPRPSLGRVAVVRHGEYGQPHPRRDIFALRDAGFEVDFYCDGEQGKPWVERVDGVTVIRLPIRHKRGSVFRYLFEYTAFPLVAGVVLAIRSFPRRYRHVEIDTMPTWLIVAAAVPKVLGAKVVLYMFEHMAELTANDHGWGAGHWLVRLIDRLEMACVRVADVVLTPAERNRELYISRGVPAEKINFIPNCPDENLFLAEVGGEKGFEQRRMEAAGRDGFRLVTHGSILQRYGIQHLIEAVDFLKERIPNLTLDVIGSGEYEGHLRELVRRKRLEDRVNFIGPVPFERIAPRLVTADLGVGPYLLDLLPNKLMEYFLLGIPTIAADWPTMRRYFGDDTVRYVPPHDVPALAAAIEDLYRNPDKRKAQATAARQRYRDTMSWSRTRDHYLAVYGAGRFADPATDGSSGDATPRGSRTWPRFVLAESRGLRNALGRLPTLWDRFGVTPAKSTRNLGRILEITDRYGVTPTFFVTAVTARRNPDVFHYLRDRGVEIGAHGFVHNDYAALSDAEQSHQVFRARDALAAIGLTVRGWRSPYSRTGAGIGQGLRRGGFVYDATPVFDWPAYQRERIGLNGRSRHDYQRLRRLFGARDAGSLAVLPSLRDGYVEIPMSIPQDEDMVDRLHLSPGEMSRVWLRMLQDSRAAGELFVICLHPERAALLARALDDTLAEATLLGDVWTARLGDIADWWLERSRTRVTLTGQPGGGGWRLAVEASQRVVTAYGGRDISGGGEMLIEAHRKPVVTLNESWPEPTRNRLTEAGYVVEAGPASEAAIFLDDEFRSTTEPEEVIRHLQGRDDLVRILPWPAGFRSSLCVSGDIDALTLFDFAMRLKEFS